MLLNHLFINGDNPKLF